MGRSVLEPVQMLLPEAAQQLLTLFIHMFVVFILTSALMEVAYIRHRWRVFVLASKLAGLFGILLFLSWPHAVFFVFGPPAFANGFCDPWCHYQSIRRNPMKRPFKLVVVAGKLLHHSGAILLCAEMFRPSAEGHTLLSLPVPIVVSVLIELYHWAEQSMVLLRMAPRWLSLVTPAVVFLQAASLVATILWVDDPRMTLSMAYLVPTAIGTLICGMAMAFGVQGSTFEVVADAAAFGSLAKSQTACSAAEDLKQMAQPISRAQLLYLVRALADDADAASTPAEGLKRRAVCKAQPREDVSEPLTHEGESQDFRPTSSIARTMFRARPLTREDVSEYLCPAGVRRGGEKVSDGAASDGWLPSWAADVRSGLWEASVADDGQTGETCISDEEASTADVWPSPGSEAATATTDEELELLDDI